MDANSRLGPSALGTLVCANGEAVVNAYCDFLYQQIAHQGNISSELAGLWKTPELAGLNYWLLKNDNGLAWLRIVEDPKAQTPEPLLHAGWLSLEVSVQNVDELVTQLPGSPFSVLRPAADLELSDKIRASQVAGPAGEVLYLTEIKGEVPPFELTPAACPVDRLFIPVLSTHDREASTVFYEKLSGRSGLRFDTKITVINQAYGYDLNRQHPVATVQLAGCSLIEIDQIDDAQHIAGNQSGLPAGIAMISFEIDNMDDLPEALCTGPVTFPAEAPYNGRAVRCLTGPAGEIIELIATRP